MTRSCRAERSAPTRERDVKGQDKGIFKDVQFYPILNFGHFWATLFSRCFYSIMNFGHFCPPPSPLTFHNVINDGQSIFWELRGDHRKEAQEGTKQYSPCFLVKTSPAEGRRRFHKNTAYARLGCLGCSGCLGCLGCSGCLGCLGCSGCLGCLVCFGCLWCLGVFRVFKVFGGV